MLDASEDNRSIIARRFTLIATAVSRKLCAYSEGLSILRSVLQRVCVVRTLSMLYVPYPCNPATSARAEPSSCSAPGTLAVPWLPWPFAQPTSAKRNQTKRRQKVYNQTQKQANKQTNEHANDHANEQTNRRTYKHTDEQNKTNKTNTRTRQSQSSVAL